MVRIRGLLIGIVFAAISVGFAAAMPGAMSVSEVDAADSIELTQSKSPKPTTSKAKGKATEPAEEVEETEHEAPGPDDNHGSVVSLVAHCKVKGRWHGEAVRSIAQNSDATAADAEAACEAAKAAAAAAPSPGRSAEAKSKSKGEDRGRPDGSESSSGGRPDHAGPPADKGKKP